MLGLLIVIVLAGCKDDNHKCSTKAVSGKETKILGSWKQVNAETVFHENQTFDYSCKTDWSCMVYEKKMTLSNAYVDGPALFFIRIK